MSVSPNPDYIRDVRNINIAYVLWMLRHHRYSDPTLYRALDVMCRSVETQAQMYGIDATIRPRRDTP